LVHVDRHGRRDDRGDRRLRVRRHLLGGGLRPRIALFVVGGGRAEDALEEALALLRHGGRRRDRARLAQPFVALRKRPDLDVAEDARLAREALPALEVVQRALAERLAVERVLRLGLHPAKAAVEDAEPFARDEALILAIRIDADL